MKITTFEILFSLHPSLPLTHFTQNIHSVLSTMEEDGIKEAARNINGHKVDVQIGQTAATLVENKGTSVMYELRLKQEDSHYALDRRAVKRMFEKNGFCVEQIHLQT